MIVLVTGGSGSGKSAYAEARAAELFQDTLENEEPSATDRNAPHLVYLATMYNDRQDPETAARIARHRGMRKGKGFRTVEQPSRIAEADVGKEDTLLLEDLPNLLANELYRERNSHPATIAEDLKRLAAKCANLVIVTGILDCDGQSYDSETTAYIRTLSWIEAEIAKTADEVTEVVAGIPVQVK